MGYLSPAPRTALVHADAWTVFRPSLELLLGRLPCRTQAAGERYPTHLADASGLSWWFDAKHNKRGVVRLSVRSFFPCKTKKRGRGPAA